MYAVQVSDTTMMTKDKLLVTKKLCNQMFQ